MGYDLIVIGGGPGGYLAAERAGHAGLKTLLIEKRFIGGVCLNEGCIPSKALLYSAKIFDYARFSEKYGVTTEGAKFDHSVALERKNKVVKSLVSGVKGALKGSKVTVIDGEAKILGRGAEGFQVAVGDDVHVSERLLIATGSESIVPPIKGVPEGVKKGFVLTNREILDIEKVPEKLVIVGGGVIGLEMASYFNSVGSKVTIIEMLGNIAGATDKDIAQILMKSYQKKGIEFKLNSKVTQVKAKSVVYEAEGKSLEAPADKVLLSIGRRPVTQGFGLENIGVELEKSAIKTDRFGRTNIAGVYAAGDVNGVYMFAHTAYREAEVCVNHMIGKKDQMRYDAIPAVIYTNPEVAGVGETEETAKAKGIEFDCATLTMKYSGRYVAENEDGEGICKVLVHKTRRNVIGVHLIGSYASEMILSAGMMIELEMKVEDIKEFVFPHPTVCEVIREGIFQL
ncbi:MAG: dihydrolipoyl dehydrogenase [Bacillota bacterium]